MKIEVLLNQLETYAPSLAAETWDHSGLLVGDPQWETSGAIISLDLTEETLQMAIENKFGLIVNHHPCFFAKSRPIQKITTDAFSGPIIKAIQSGIAVVACHTNFDRCSLEVVQKISSDLGLEIRGRFGISKSKSENLLKLVVYVPAAHLEAVQKAICEAGAGQIGKYDRCSFSVAGTGTFRAGEGAHPFLGQSGVIEKVQEFRLETIVPMALRKQVLQAMRKSHPYEEIAFDLYELHQPASVNSIIRGLGYGFWGEFNAPKPFSEVIKSVRNLFKVNGFLMNEAPESISKPLKRLGFIAGNGGSFVREAIDLKCDLLISGEVGYHNARDGAQHGLTIIELGHAQSERFFLKTVGGWLKEMGLKTIELENPIQRFWQESASDSTATN